MTATVQRYVVELVRALTALSPERVNALTRALEMAAHEDRTVFVAGNGGSSATASHMACDLSKTAYNGGAKLRVQCLTDAIPTLTAWANDCSYDTALAYALGAHARPRDLLILISASGRSQNLVTCALAARDRGMTTVGMLGAGGGALSSLVDHAIVVPSNDYGVIEDVHLAINHMVTRSLRGEPVRVTVEAMAGVCREDAVVR